MRIVQRLSLAIVTLAFIAPALAQSPAPMPAKTSITLPVGAVLEIVPVHSISNPEFGWSLMMDSTFLQAGRNEVFRSRMIEAGTYLLRGEVRSLDNSKRHRLELTVQVSGTLATEAPVAAGSGILAETNPGIDGFGRMAIQDGNPIIRITPSATLEQPVILDIDAKSDADGDNNPRNDQVAPDLFFSTNHTPLHLWFTEPMQERTMTLSLRGRIDTEESIELLQQDKIREQDAEREQQQRREQEAQARILVAPFGSGTVKLSMRVPPEYESSPLLIHWNFGDGQQSLLDAPLHTYASNGSYSVTAVLRNLNEGEEIGSYTSIVNISNASTGGQVPEQPEPDPTQDPESEGEGGSILPAGLFATIGKFLLGIIASVAIGFLFTLLLRFLRRGGGFSGAVDRAESVLVGNTPDTPVSEEPEPMALSLDDEEGEEEEKVAEEKQGEPEPPQIDVPPRTPEPSAVPEAPKEEAAPAPDWLKQTTQPTPTAPVSSSEQETAAPAQPEPTIPTQTSQPEAANDGPKPAWLGGNSGSTSTPRSDTSKVTDANTDQRNDVTTPSPNSSPQVDEKPAETASSAPMQENQPEATQEAAINPASDAPAVEPVKQDTEPAWSPAPEELQDAPDWLKQGVAESDSAKASEPATPPAQEQVSLPTAETESTTPPKATDDTTQQKDWDSMTPEEKEKEKKRQKRQRYRKNKRERVRQEKAEQKEDVPEKTEDIPTPEVPKQTEDSTVTESASTAEEQPKKIQEKPESAGEPQPILPAEDDVKFIIGADSITDKEDKNTDSAQKAG